MKSEKISENPRDFFNTFQPFISNKTAKNNPISLNIDGNVTKNDAVAIANCFANYFANVALTIGGQHVHDLLEEDHQYNTSIKSIKLIENIMLQISTFKYLLKLMCPMLLKILILGNRLVGTLLLYPSSLRKPPLLLPDL